MKVELTDEERAQLSAADLAFVLAIEALPSVEDVPEDRYDGRPYDEVFDPIPEV